MIDILVACYNGENFLKQQLDSLINQTYQDFNIILRDDGSKDSSLKILKQFKADYPDKVTLIEGNPTGGAKNNFFELMNHTDADYIMFCDQDDVWLENKVEITLSKMKDTENAYGKDVPVLCHTDLSVADKDLNITHNSFFKMQKFDISKTSLNRALVQNIVTGCTVMINRALLNIAKGTNSNDVIMHDWWLFLIASAFGRVEAINSPTILYRQHENNQVGAKSLSPLTHTQMACSINTSVCQAIWFLRCYSKSLSSSQIEMIEQYSNLHKHSVLKRMCILRRFQLYKHPFIKKLFQIITISKLKRLSH